MLITDDDHEMEHEPMRTDSTSDITLAQPMIGLAADMAANAQPLPQAYINNNPGLLHGQPLINSHLWYQYAASLNPLSQSFWGSMGNHHSATGSGHQGHVTVDGISYDIAQTKMLIANMNDDRVRTQVRLNS